MKFINEWKSPLKQWDKINIVARLGKITLLAINCDFSQKYLKLTLLNLTLTN